MQNPLRRWRAWLRRRAIRESTRVRATPLDPSLIARPLSDLLGVELAAVRTRIQQGSWRFRAYAVDARDTHRRTYPLLVKRVQDTFYLPLYKDILQPYRLNSPVVYGHIETAEGLFLVMEYVSHKQHGPQDQQALDQIITWLARKDRVVGARLPEVQATGYIASTSGRTSRIADCLGFIQRALDLGWPSSAARAVFEMLLAGQDGLSALSREVARRSPQTLAHCDFTPANVLFGTREHEGELYVVDWSYSGIDSVCVDLAELVASTPGRMRSWLVRRYQAQNDFEDLDEVLGRAGLLTKFFHFTWEVSAINAGDRTADSPRFQRWLDDIRAMLGDMPT